MIGVNFKFADIYLKNGKCYQLHNFYFTKHSNNYCEWLRAHSIEAYSNYGLGDFRLDQIEKITGILK